MITKIISGGQTGADQGGLSAAISLGLQTGGMMPKGFRTDIGDRPDLRTRCNMQEHTSREYPPRTACNVRDSDGTFIFGIHTSPGSKLTLKLCKQYNKPFFSMDWRTGDIIEDPRVETFKGWLEGHNIRILNVAGNREKSNPGVYIAVQSLLIKVLKDAG